MSNAAKTTSAPLVSVRVVGRGGPLLNFQQDFPPGYPDHKILKDLERGKARFGRAASIVKPDTSKDRRGQTSGIPAAHPDPASPMLWDDPRTRVVAGFMQVPEGGGLPVFVETRVLREAITPQE